MPLSNYDGRGQWYVGLNPDERMPNDWLRMVARVFTAYRGQPLQESIVSYIDGLNISLGTRRPSSVDINITLGQAFVDDQFIGFTEPSVFEAPLAQVEIAVFGTKFFVVLKYKFINQYPVQEPTFDLVLESEINSEEMLVLGYIYCEDDGAGGCDLVIVDEKKPWWREWVDAAVGNTEVDPESLLPYIIAIKGPGDGEYPEDPDDSIGTMDIGWSVDFHHTVGNHKNYDLRLHTDKLNDDYLYINNNRVITEIGNDGTANNDPMDLGDKTATVHNNMTLSDIQDDFSLDGNPYPASDSGKACLSLRTEHIDATGDSKVRYSAMCSNHDDNSLSIYNQNTDMEYRNVMKWTDEEDRVTINGKNIWHAGNMMSSGSNLMFLGYLDNEPTERPPSDSYPANSPLESGDTFYSNIEQAFYYYVINNVPHPGDGGWVQVGATDLVKSYQFVIDSSNEGIPNFTIPNIEYNPDFIMVSVGGSILAGQNQDQNGSVSQNPAAEYIAADGMNITFLNPLKSGETIKIYTTLTAQAFGIRLDELSNVEISNLLHGQSLVYDNVSGAWRNSDVAGGGGQVEFLNDIGDVNVAGVNPNDLLVRNAANNRWEPGRGYLHAMGDTAINTPQVNEILTYDGVNWINAAAQGGGQDALTGTVIIWSADTAPQGYLECNGSLLNRVTYSTLFNIIGTTYGAGDGATTFRLPDLRGEFIRGWDNGRGIDTFRGLGSNQNDAIRNITGQIGHPSNTSTPYDGLFLQSHVPSTGVLKTIPGTYQEQTATGAVLTNLTGRLNFDASLVVPTASENRPRNVAMMYCIKF